MMVFGKEAFRFKILLVFGNSEDRHYLLIPSQLCSIAPIPVARIPSVPMGISFALAAVHRHSRPYSATATA
jgi:hypothetical protein